MCTTSFSRHGLTISQSTKPIYIFSRSAWEFQLLHIHAPHSEFSVSKQFIILVRYTQYHIVALIFISLMNNELSSLDVYFSYVALLTL